jgi:hypothetical protein
MVLSRDTVHFRDDFLGNDPDGDVPLGPHLAWELEAIGNASTTSYVTGEPGGVLRDTTAAGADGDGETYRSFTDGIVLNGKAGGFRAKVRYPAVTGNTVEDNNFRIGLDESTVATAYPSLGTISFATTDIGTLAAHGLTNNDRITVLTSAATGIVAGDNLWVLVINASTFKVSADRNGTPVDVTGAGDVTAAVLYSGITAPTDGIWVESDGGILSLQAHSNDHGDNFAAVGGVGSLASLETTPAATGTAATDLITLAGHGLQDGKLIHFMASDATGIAAGDELYVIGATSSTFQVSATEGGTAVNITGDGTAVTWKVVGGGGGLAGPGSTMRLGVWHELEVRWSGENAQGGPAWVDLWVDGYHAAQTQCAIDNDETMELKMAHWQNSGGGSSLEFDVDYFEVFLTP